MNFEVSGTDRKTGSPRAIVVDAESEAQAAGQVAADIVVQRIRDASENPRGRALWPRWATIAIVGLGLCALLIALRPAMLAVSTRLTSSGDVSETDGGDHSLADPMMKVGGYVVAALVLVWVVAAGVRMGTTRSVRAGIDDRPGRFRVHGVDRDTKMDTTWRCNADSAGNAKIKAELEGIVVSRVERE
jgi:hypothetical protein